MPTPRTRPSRPSQRFLLCTLGLASIGLAASLAGASISDLIAFLERAERMATPQRAVKASVTLTEGEGTQSFVLIIDPASSSQLFWDGNSGFRAVTPLDWGKGKKIASAGAKVEPIEIDSRLANSDFRGLDFFPFWKAEYGQAFISDENRLEKSVSIYGRKDGPYKLFLIAFDKAKMVPRSIKYFRESFNDLERVRVDSDHVMVGTRPRPTKIRFQDFSQNSQRAYELQWEVLETPPGDLMQWTGK